MSGKGSDAFLGKLITVTLLCKLSAGGPPKTMNGIEIIID